MSEQTASGFWARWLGDESTPGHRALVVVPALIAALLVWVALIEWTRFDGFALPFVVLAVLLVGIVARTWWVLLTAFAGAVLMFWVIEISTYAWIGSHEWEHRNAEHWQGNEPAIEKLIGQLMEYAVFAGIFMVPVIAIGVLFGRWLGQNRHDHHQPRQLDRGTA